MNHIQSISVVSFVFLTSATECTYADASSATDTTWFVCADPSRINVVDVALNPLRYSDLPKSISFVPRAAACQFKFADGVIFDTDFLTGRLSGVTQTGPNEFEVVVRPENQPINLSPWFAFRVNAKKKQRILVVLRYEGIGFGLDEKTGKPPEAGHLYGPVIKTANATDWARLADDLAVVQQNGKAVRLLLDVDQEPMLVAAHEVVTSKDVGDWIQRLTNQHKVKAWVVGRSIGGREIPAFAFGKGGRDSHTIVVLGRAHPPEVTGWFALQTFIETLLTDPRANHFRENFQVVVFPLLNPDGVDLGHWRHNLAGVDINRDWELASQPEIQAIQQELRSFSHVVFGIDFHSTGDDTLYVQPRDWKPKKPSFSVPEWFCAIADKHKDWKVKIQPVKPGRYVSQGWIAGEYGVSSVTWEVGYLTNRDAIDRLAKTAAIELADAKLK